MSEQAQLFADPGNAARYREKRLFHECVIFLRKKGYAVHRAGTNQTMVDHRRLENRDVVKIARKLGYK